MKIHSFFSDEEGAALTEFVIGLPIFIILFSGILSIYQISEESIGSMLDANHALWVESQSTSIAAMTPLNAGADFLTQEKNTSAIGMLNGLSQVGGIYSDAWAKNEIASKLFPGAPGEGVEPLQTIGEIHANFTSKSPSQKMLDDNILNSNVDLKLPSKSLVGMALSVAGKALELSGAKLGFATGIRYGQVTGASKEKSVSTALGNYKIKKMSISLPRNTETTHRWIPVMVARMQLNDPQLDSLLEIQNTPDTSGAPDWGTQKDERGSKDRCSIKKKKYKTCLEKSKEKYAEDWAARCDAYNASRGKKVMSCQPGSMPQDDLGYPVQGDRQEMATQTRKTCKKSKPDC